MPSTHHTGCKRKASCPSHPPQPTAYFPSSSSASTSYLPLSPPPAYPAAQPAPPAEPSAKRAKKRSERLSYSELAQWFAELICSVWFTVPSDDGPAQTTTPAYPALTHGTTNLHPSTLKPIALSPADWTSRRLHPTSDFVMQLRDIFRSLRPSQESLLVASYVVNCLLLLRGRCSDSMHVLYLDCTYGDSNSSTPICEVVLLPSSESLWPAWYWPTSCSRTIRIRVRLGRVSSAYQPSWFRTLRTKCGPHWHSAST